MDDVSRYNGLDLVFFLWLVYSGTAGRLAEFHCRSINTSVYFVCNTAERLGVKVVRWRRVGSNATKNLKDDWTYGSHRYAIDALQISDSGTYEAMGVAGKVQDSQTRYCRFRLFVKPSSE